MCISRYYNCHSVIGPQEAANLPTVGAGEFDVYVATNEDGSTDGGLIDDVNPSWGQSGSAEIEVHPQAGAVLKVNGMNYQGMTMTATDVSGKTSYIDLWSVTAGTVRLFLINTDGGEAGFNLDVTADTWNSFDIDLDAFGTVPDVAIHQLKFDNSEGSIGAGVTGLTDFYVDNLYFGDQAATVERLRQTQRLLHFWMALQRQLPMKMPMALFQYSVTNTLMSQRQIS